MTGGPAEGYVPPYRKSPEKGSAMKRAARATVLLSALSGVLGLVAVPVHSAVAAPASCYFRPPYGVSPSTSGPTGATYAKLADSCLDLNLVNADDGRGANVQECYIGWYKNSSGRFVASTVGRKCKLNAPKFGSPVVLVSNVATGTFMGVSSVSYSASVSVEY